ncbi:hypothetical protein Taro_001651 [Colocasia esculenta]|uniref:Methyltransferase domain-containing protein n=1 Tax=Colocasia esculenta TaxID=4460 RepID=A0A843TGJ1_COLES|nr:hypothetical protein [Colocasia esculenta]
MVDVNGRNPEGPHSPEVPEAMSRSTAGAGTVPQSVSAYIDPGYWDERFAEEEHYEWLKDYSHFKHLIRRYVQPCHSVLEIGCGSSRLSEALLEDGVADITSTDISVVAVDRMRRRLQAKGLKGVLSSVHNAFGVYGATLSEGGCFLTKNIDELGLILSVLIGLPQEA